jgi:hypothetical protein
MMAYLATNYATDPKAPANKWVCAPGSKLGPFDTAPTKNTGHPDYCGQCVSYVKVVCPVLPATAAWKKGEAAKGNKTILAGTVIATFNANDKYEGHAAIYVSQDENGLRVYDQYIYGVAKGIGPRVLRFGAHGDANNGDKFFIVE